MFLFIFGGRDVKRTQADTAEPVSVVNTNRSFVAPAFVVLSLPVSFLQSREEGAVSICNKHPTICRMSWLLRDAGLCICNTLALAKKLC